MRNKITQDTCFEWGVPYKNTIKNIRNGATIYEEGDGYILVFTYGNKYEIVKCGYMAFKWKGSEKDEYMCRFMFPTKETIIEVEQEEMDILPFGYYELDEEEGEWQHILEHEDNWGLFSKSLEELKRFREWRIKADIEINKNKNKHLEKLLEEG